MDGLHLRISRYSLSYRNRLLGAAAHLRSFLRKHKLDWNLVTKGRSKDVDIFLDQIVSELYEQRTTRPGSLQLAKHAVLFCQVCRPRLKHKLKQTWASLKSWEEHEPGRLRPPLPIAVMMGMICQARISSELATSSSDRHKWLTFSTLIMMGFFGLLRPGELLNLRRKDLGLPHHVSLALPSVTISLDKPKNFRQLGMKQFSSIKHSCTCEWICWLCQNLNNPEDRLWPHSHAEFRRMFKKCVSLMHVEACRFSPGSLRAGGATFLFDEEEDIGRLRLIGRWSNIQSLEHYVQSAKSQQMLQNLSDKAVHRLENLLRKGSFLLSLPARSLAKIPEEQRLNPPSLEVHGRLWQACRVWGRAQAAV